jgi:hypothetical protein
MREDLELETLEDRRLSLRLILMYKVVEGPRAVFIGADSLERSQMLLRNMHARHCLADGSNELVSTKKECWHCCFL